jgi:hypothetical protein
MTEKLPGQSSRAVISAASRSPASSGFGIGIRSNTTPLVRGSADPLASSPKSLSKVSKIRWSRAAHASTSGSGMPGATILTHTTSCPAAAREATAAAGKFSLARKRKIRPRSETLSPSSVYREHRRDTRGYRRAQYLDNSPKYRLRSIRRPSGRSRIRRKVACRV